MTVPPPGIVIASLGVFSPLKLSSLEVPPLKPGDTVAIRNVGAYGLTASLVAFTGLQPPAEVCCRGTSVIAVHRLRTGHKRIST